MKNSKQKSKKERLHEFDRLMLRSAFVSLFWAAILERRKRGKFTLQSLARKLHTNKSAVSRWFSGEHPNWTIDKIMDIANALNLDLSVKAVDRSTNQIFTSTGALHVAVPIEVTGRESPAETVIVDNSPKTSAEDEIHQRVA